MDITLDHAFENFEEKPRPRHRERSRSDPIPCERLILRAIVYYSLNPLMPWPTPRKPLPEPRRVSNPLPNDYATRLFLNRPQSPSVSPSAQTILTPETDSRSASPMPTVDGLLRAEDRHFLPLKANNFLDSHDNCALYIDEQLSNNIDGDSLARVCKERDAFAEENRRLKELLAAHNVPSDTASQTASPECSTSTTNPDGSIKDSGASASPMYSTRSIDSLYQEMSPRIDTGLDEQVCAATEVLGESTSTTTPQSQHTPASESQDVRRRGSEASVPSGYHSVDRPEFPSVPSRHGSSTLGHNQDDVAQLRSGSSALEQSHEPDGPSLEKPTEKQRRHAFERHAREQKEEAMKRPWRRFE